MFNESTLASVARKFHGLPDDKVFDDPQQIDLLLRQALKKQFMDWAAIAEKLDDSEDQALTEWLRNVFKWGGL
ncbi:MAG: hypothetical protein JSU67_03485 [Gammaproteobacteria bacterium]|nr:MAG: hypothetical protein JSU67_03485 [Gammaproteobacteria bacterium]